MTDMVIMQNHLCQEDVATNVMTIMLSLIEYSVIEVY